jgi:hypothetical protein
MLDPEIDPADGREASEAPEEATEVEAVQPPAPPERPARPAPPRVAIRVIDHPTDWVDGGSDEAPRVSTVLNRLPSFDASFFDAPPTEPVAPADGATGGLRVHTGAEQDASFGDFVGGGDTADADAELPGGVTAAVRRTAPLSAEAVATTAAAVQFGVPEPAIVDVTMPRRHDHDRRRKNRRTMAMVVPGFFAVLMVLTVLLTRSPSRPHLDAQGGTPTTAQHAATTTVAPRPTTTAAGPTTTASPDSTVGTVGAAAVGPATNAPAPVGGTTKASGGGGGGTSSPTTTRTTSPPTTSPPPPPTTSPPTTVCPPYICK